MANTKAQGEAEKWIRQVALPSLYKKHFEKRSLQLRESGEFSFDAVSDDSEIVACISTSAGITAAGKKATSKLQKIRSDALWFYMLPKMPSKALLVFTDDRMITLIRAERDKGRFPSEFELLKIELPAELARKVEDSQKRASDEVTPTKTKT